MKLSIRIAEIANQLDGKKLYKLADEATKVLERLAYFAGPQNTNLPMKSRVVPMSEIEETLTDQDEKRKNFPEYRMKEFEPNDPSDVEDAEGSLTDMNNAPVNGITMRMEDSQSMGYTDPSGSGGDFDFDTQRDYNNRGYPKFLPK